MRGQVLGIKFGGRHKKRSETMENIEIMLSLIGTIIGLVLTVLTFVVKSIRNAKVQKGLKQAIKISNAVLPFIREAEKFASYSGAEKKAYVMIKANQFAITNRIKFDANQVSDKIEELVALTRQVNFKPTAKEKAEIAKDIAAVTAEANSSQINAAIASTWL